MALLAAAVASRAGVACAVRARPLPVLVLAHLRPPVPLRHARGPARALARGHTTKRPLCAAAGGSNGGKQRVVVLTGPTGVGKTSLSLALAEAIGAEIISADSVQVYEGLDVGSDKIPLAERRGITHHLIDILPPSEEFSAGDFSDLGRNKVSEILKRGKTPLVVGGTGFYLKFFLHGKVETPRSTTEGSDRAKRKHAQEVQEEANRLGRPCSEGETWDIGVRLVRDAGDERSAKTLEESRNNFFRLYRYLEIILETGKPLPEVEDDPTKLDFDFRCFFLHRPRIQLYRKIDARCEEMILEGILEEAQQLLDDGLGPASCMAARGIGYRQALEFLCEEDLDWDDDDAMVAALQQMVLDMQTASRRLVTRQMTMMRDNDLFRWVDATQGEAAVLSDILSELASEAHCGGSQDYGRLTKDEQQQVKRYRAELQHLSSRQTCLDVISKCRKRALGRHSVTASS